jgi:hypothetical protein
MNSRINYAQIIFNHHLVSAKSWDGNGSALQMEM